MEKTSIKVVTTGWGYKEAITNNSQYCAMIVHLNNGKRSSAHYHLKKLETYCVISGIVKVYYSENVEEFKRITEENKNNKDFDYTNHLKSCILNPNDIFEISPGIVHQVYAMEDSVFLEISSQHTESDMFRVLLGD